MRCFDAKRFVHAYVDGEFDAVERGEFEGHLRTCNACRDQVRFEDWFQSGVREHIPRTLAPVHLRDRVLTEIQQAPAPTPVRSLPARLGWAAVPAVLAAAGLGILVWVAAGAGPTNDIALTTAVDMHRRYLPVEVAGPDVNAAREFFRGKVDFAVRPFMPAAASAVPAQFVGARLSHIGPATAAHLMYDVAGHRLSVMAFQAPNDQLRGREVHTVGPWQVHMDRRDGYNVAMFRDRDITWAVTSDIEPNQMIRFVSAGMR